MGGLGPGIGGLEYIVIALVALLVLGPERLPVMLRKLGEWVAKARAMANDFRASFDEMARQSELDDLRKEVEALRRGQGLVPLGSEAEAAFKDINAELAKPIDAPAPTPAAAPALSAPEEWPEPTPVVAAPVEPKPKRVRKPKAEPVAEADGAPRPPPGRKRPPSRKKAVEL